MSFQKRRSFTLKNISTSLPFFMIHLACFAALWTGVDLPAVLLCAGVFVVRKFGITAGYHRYFSHRSFQTSRPVQFALAWLGCSATQKGPLWWAGHHRVHHQNSDLPNDIHSVKRDGFWWSHFGWILSGDYDETNHRVIPDFAKFPELRWLNRHHLVPPVALALGCFLLQGWMGVVWGFVISTTLLWHTTFLINSACHVFGWRRYATRDTSKNNLWLALVTLGEGWHNNHHYYPSSVNQGFFWWEIDVTYYILKIMSWFGLVWDLRRPPAQILTSHLV